MNVSWNRQNAAHVRVCGRGRRRNRGRLPLVVVVVVEEAEGETTLAMAEGRRVERPGRVSGQIAWPGSNEHDGVHEARPEIWLAEGSHADGDRLERALRHWQAESKNGAGKRKSNSLEGKRYRVSFRKDRRKRERLNGFLENK